MSDELFSPPAFTRTTPYTQRTCTAGSSADVMFYGRAELCRKLLQKVPQDVYILQNTELSGFHHDFPSKMKFGENVLLDNCTSNVFGKNTEIALDLEIRNGGLVALHPSIVIGGVLRADSNTSLLIDYDTFKNIYKIDRNVHFAVYTNASSAASVLNDLFPDDAESARRYHAQVASILKTGHLRRMTKTMLGGSYVHSAFSHKSQDGESSHVILSTLSGVAETTFDRNVYIRDSDVVSFSLPLQVKGTLVIENCDNLRTLPKAIMAKSVVIRNCNALETLQSNFFTDSVSIENCDNLHDLQTSSEIQNLSIMKCPNLSEFAIIRAPKVRKVLSDVDLYSSVDSFFSEDESILQENRRSAKVLSVYFAMSRVSSEDVLSCAETVILAECQNEEKRLQIVDDLSKLVASGIGHRSASNAIEKIHKRYPTITAVEDKTEHYEKMSLQELLEKLALSEPSNTDLQQQLMRAIAKKTKKLQTHPTPSIRLK